MNIIAASLEGVKLIEPTCFEDARGFFMESYQQETFNEAGINDLFIQDNHSYSAEAGVLRGLHYQLPPAAQAKLVRATAGAIYDVVVDLRKGSPTYGKWEGFILSAANRRQLYVPRGFAHGFCTLVPHCEVQYKVDALYAQELDRGIAWNDPELAIPWPVRKPILSAKDTRHPPLNGAEHAFVYEGGGGKG